MKGFGKIALLLTSLSFGNGVLAADLIVRLKPEASASRFLKTERFQGYEVVRVLVPELDLYLVRTPGRVTAQEALADLRGIEDVRYAQEDHPVQLRHSPKVPDDGEFAKQWSLNPNSKFQVGIMDAWDLGTGGRTQAGDDIVVAVVDDGMAIQHPDLRDNLWVNKNEIAGNGKDDDGNGYIDDINGWSAYSNSGKISESLHGTHVAGIIGARGNNRNQVVGVNWDVKIMAVEGSSSSTSTISAAYGYVLKQKKLWLSSNGTLGANVVATNSSFGVDYAKCDSGDYPVWNDLYNEMGKVGILSAAATANNNVNIDDVGDVPTGCSSAYLINVTNTDKDDKRGFAGFGLKSVHLGAPGTGIHSTINGGKTGALTGTSMATPHVAGTVGLLHHVASRNFLDLVKRDPAEAALKLKDIILNTVDANADLAGKTVTGGRLNVGKAAQSISQY